MYPLFILFWEFIFPFVYVFPFLYKVMTPTPPDIQPVKYLSRLLIRRVGGIGRVFDKVVVDDVTLLVVLATDRAPHDVHWWEREQG